MDHDFDKALNHQACPIDIHATLWYKDGYSG